MIRTLLVFAAACAVLIAAPLAALARPAHVVVGPVQNDDDGDVLGAIRAAIGADVVLAGKRDVTKASDKLKLSEQLTDKEAAKLLKALGADALVKGMLDKGDDKSLLHLKIYLKAGGKPKAVTLSFGNAASEKFRAALRKTILAKVGAPVDDSDAEPAGGAGAGAGAGAGGDDDGDPFGNDGGAPAKPAKPAKPVKPPAGKGKPGKQAPKPPPPDETGDDDGGDENPLPHGKTPPKKKPPAPAPPSDGDADGSGEGSGSGSGSDTAPAAPAPAAHAPRSANRDAVRVATGLSVTSRQLIFASRDFPQAPKPFKNGAVPGFRLEGEIYPLAFKTPQAAASGIGLAFLYDKTLSLTLDSVLTDGSPVSASANQSRYTIGPRFRYVLGHTPTSASFTFGVDYAVRQFIVDRSKLGTPSDIDLPDIKYQGIAPSVSVRVPFAPAIALVGSGGAILVTSAGAIQDLDQYGQATVTGGQISLGLDVVIKQRVSISLVGEFAEYGFTFKGNGAMSNARDGDATTVDIGGAADRYFGGALTVAVLY